MKIAHVIPALTKGGAERVVVDLANQAIADGHSTTIIVAVAADYKLLPAPLDSRVALRTICPAGTSVRSCYARLPLWLWSNRAWLMSLDVVHCHLTFGSVFGSLLQTLRRRLGARFPRVIETYHAVGVAIPKAKRLLHARLLARRDALAFMAEDPFWTAFRARRPDQLLVTIPNGVASGPNSRECARLIATGRGDSQRAPVVGSIGRLVAERRPDLLLEAFAAILGDLETPPHLLLGGEGPQRQAIARRARELGISDRVHLPGLVLDPAALFTEMDLYLTVNVGPVTGIAAIEAALAGLPVIAVQMNGEYVASADDWIWSSPDPQSVARRARELLADSDARAALAERQCRYAREKHSVVRMARAYSRLYVAAIEAAGEVGECR